MTVIPEMEFKSILDEMGFKQPKRFLMNSPYDYRGNFPAVLKVSSGTITHKTESGAVVTDIKNIDILAEVLKGMKNKFPDETIYAEEMAKRGVEVIVGLINDQQFGKLLLFGVGGFYSELIRDVTFKKVPLDRYDAEDLLEELKFGSILNGYRGLKANKGVLIDFLLKVSDFSIQHQFSQIDFNPVFLYEDDYLIIDAKMVI
ncbi:MAG: acetate--CoA ligase family protein [Thermoplasmatales archaeon]|jgi:succinyl-CoA synthetase beta subunit|nr:acetate--CoA ligase family protein [Candidatus Thermoplasmatota archaeon]MCL6002158.1 acetate--CoA ligase family protein [Candidatus Thermoplasmatota archaeon]MDA8055962.1 acetate--CoA ligase family protein [Thermoplasmatales archaeon]